MPQITNINYISYSFIEINWKPAKNTGFHFTTELAYTKLNVNAFTDIAKYKTYPYQTDSITDIFECNCILLL